MLWKSQKDETGCHADVPSHGHGSSLCCQRSPKGRFLGSEKPGEENTLFCHGIIASPSHKRHRKANVQPLPYAEFLSTAFIGSFMESIVIPILMHYSCKTDSSRRTGIFALSGSWPSLPMPPLYWRKLLIELGLNTPFFSLAFRHCGWIIEPLRFMLDTSFLF